MGSVRVRKGSNNLFFDFQYKGLRCREQTTLPDTPANRKKMESMLQRIEAEILLDQFNYENYFPNSSILEKIKRHTRKLDKFQSGIPDLKSFAWTWFEELEVGWRRTYSKTISGILKRYILKYYGDYLLNEITKPELMKFRAKIAKKVNKKGKSINPVTVNKVMKIFKMIISEGTERFNFKNPFRGIKPLATRKFQIQPFTLDEVMLFISKVREDFKNYYTIRFFTGMRTSEIDGLKWKYIDFDNRLIQIREALVQGHMEYTKNDYSQREIMMSQPVYEAFKKQYEVTGNHEFVFCTRNLKPLDYCNVNNRIWAPTLRYLGFQHRRAYETRHTAATLWLASGENPEWIARQMGHANTEMLFRVYSRYVPNLTRQDGSAFDKLINSKIDNF